MIYIRTEQTSNGVKLCHFEQCCHDQAERSPSLNAVNGMLRKATESVSHPLLDAKRAKMPEKGICKCVRYL